MTFEEWIAELDRRHLADLTPSEVGRALRALSSCYVERRARLSTGAALEGAGKRAAFALFYAVQHFLIGREIARTLFPAGAPDVDRIVDLGCGTGTAGAAVAQVLGTPRIEGYDINTWAAAEANWTYRAFGIRGRATVANVRAVRLPQQGLVLAAYAVNELADDVRRGLLARMLDAQQRGASILIVEPIARRANPWWTEWVDALGPRGGRENEWRFRITLPDRQRALAAAAGLDVRELTARSLSL
ncbi:MAG TPA: class I SAM-dependent methyltransferase [Vicinamibacterales bacterium]|nr:class I SAM-dependent methyltransferase [Vicinamibacterales bacterium]